MSSTAARIQLDKIKLIHGDANLPTRIHTDQHKIKIWNKTAHR